MLTFVDVEDIESAVALKRGRRVSVCLPCRNEEETVGRVVGAILADERSAALIDELVVLDDGSTDRSAELAAHAGARVVRVDDLQHDVEPLRGKGNVLWASLRCTGSEFIVWIDADVISANLAWVARLLIPMFEDDGVAMVKAAYSRPTDAGGGGRTTELVVRPLLSLLAPELSWISQPLGGEVAVRRELISQLPVAAGWGVEIAMLMDVVDRFGADAIAQVHLGERRHRHHDLLSLRVQAAEVMATILGRSGVALAADPPLLQLPDGSSLDLNLAERPPLAG